MGCGHGDKEGDEHVGPSVICVGLEEVQCVFVNKGPEPPLLGDFR